jgi:hypothetical protein
MIALKHQDVRASKKTTTGSLIATYTAEIGGDTGLEKNKTFVLKTLKRDLEEMGLPDNAANTDTSIING